MKEPHRIDVKLPNGEVISVVKKHRPRHCDKCDAAYHRRAMIVCWPIQNKGHTWGWIRFTIRLGVDCCAGQHFSRMLFRMATVSIGYNGPSDLLKPPIEMEKVRIGIKAGIFKMIEKPKAKKQLTDQRV